MIATPLISYDTRLRRAATSTSNITDPTALSYPVVYKAAFGTWGDLLLHDYKLTPPGYTSDIFLANDGTYFNNDGDPILENGLLTYTGSGTFFGMLCYPIQAPSITLSVRVESVTTVGQQYIELGFGFDLSNYIGVYYNVNSGGWTWELKDSISGNVTPTKGDGTSAAISGTITFPATLRVSLNARSISVWWNDSLLGVAEIPTAKFTRFDTLKATNLSAYRPFVKVIHNNAGDRTRVSAIQLHTGCRMSYREPNLITYEDGTPIRDTNGDMFVSVTHQFPTSQTNQRSLASTCWGIYRYDPNSMEMTLIGTMFENRAGSIYGFCIGKMLFDRNSGKWKMWALDVGSRPFLSSDGTNNKWWNHYYETALCPMFGVNVLDYDNNATDLTISGLSQALITGTSAAAGDSVYDIDVAYVSGLWYMAFTHPGTGIRYTTSTNGTSWTAPVTTTNTGGEGTRIRKMGGTWYVMAGTAAAASPYGYSISTLLTNTLIGTIPLTYVTANIVQHPNLICVPTVNGKTIYRFDSFDTVAQGGWSWSYGGRSVLQCTTQGTGLEFADVRGIPNQ